uniref:ITPR-interacting domain-containing protein n=1 Tax=Otus sunia TaxID=257818 RepID=A0A8C8AZT0_9STRI
MQMFTLGKNHNDIPEEHMSNTFHCCFFPTRCLQEFSESPVMSRCTSLSSSHLLTGAPQSITEWLALWEKDPVEILLDLGFGTEEPDVSTKIPPRFLSGVSVAKGINIRVFLEAQKQRVDIERPKLYERFRQLEVLDHVTSALSSLLTDINTQQTKAQDTGRDEPSLLDAEKSKPAVTRAKQRTIGQLLKRASWQTMLLKQSLLAPREANLPSRKEQPCSCADIAESGTVQASFSARVTLVCLSQEETPGQKGASMYPMSQCPPTPSGKTWASSHLVAKQPHLSPACEVPAKDRLRKETHLLVAHTLTKVADLSCRLPDSFEMEEVRLIFVYCARCVKGPWWGVGVVGEDGTPLAVNEVTNGQKFCKTDGDSKNTKCFPKMGLPETLQWGSAAQIGSSASSSCSLQVSRRHPSGLAEGPGLCSSSDQETGSIGEILGANKSEQGDTVQNGEMASAPLKSLTVQMSSGLEFTSRTKGTGQNSDPGALKDGVTQTAEASSQTDMPTRKPRWPPLLSPPRTHLTKSASLDSMLCGKHRSGCWGEGPGAKDALGSHCCHCCCCHGCCPWTFPVAASLQRPAGCSNRATTELQLLKTLMLLQDTARRNLAPCTLHEIEVMKSSCQRFQEKLDEIEQHLIEQQALFSDTMQDEGREEGRHLQLLRQAVRQEVAELEFQLNDQSCQIRESILMQLDQLLAEQSHLSSELGLSDWKGERKAQSKQAFPDAADITHPPSGCSDVVLQRAPSKNTTATGSLSAPQPGAPSVQFPTRTTPESNSAESVPQELSTSKKEIKGPPQAKMDFKTFMHNVRRCFSLTLKVLSGRDH